jgi:biopolymer transport protein ExbB/TolQ
MGNVSSSVYVTAAVFAILLSCSLLFLLLALVSRRRRGSFTLDDSTELSHLQAIADELEQQNELEFRARSVEARLLEAREARDASDRGSFGPLERLGLYKF